MVHLLSETGSPEEPNVPHHLPLQRRPVHVFIYPVRVCVWSLRFVQHGWSTTNSIMTAQRFFYRGNVWTKGSKDWKVWRSHSHALDVAFGINMCRGIYAKFVKPDFHKTVPTYVGQKTCMWLKRDPMATHPNCQALHFLNEMGKLCASTAPRHHSSQIQWRSPFCWSWDHRNRTGPHHTSPQCGLDQV